MLNLPKLTDYNLHNKKVLLRADLDFDPTDLANLRLTSLTPTLNYLTSQNALVTLISHRGRPEGKVDDSLSLHPFAAYFEKWHVNLLENLRFNSQEESGSAEFARQLSLNQDFFVNESFATSHRPLSLVYLNYFLTQPVFILLLKWKT